MIGQRIKELRIEKDISQKELANILDVVPSNISMYESNERTPPPEVLVKLSKYFNVTADYLLGLSESKSGSLLVPNGYMAVLSEAVEKEVSPDKLKKLIQLAKELEGE